MNATETSIVEQFPFWNGAKMPTAITTDNGALRVVVGCGTSYNLALSVASALNRAGVFAIAVPAGEWGIRPDTYVPAGTKVEVIALSRSGETTETVAAAAASRARGHRVISITCEPGSALCAPAHEVIEFDTHPAEGIVMTASASLMLLAGLALAGLSVDDALTTRAEVGMRALQSLDLANFHERSHVVFLGAGVNYGIALEGALKLQEMAICYTQAFHPGEYRHGPVSLVDERTAAVMLYHPDTSAAEAELVAELQEKGAFVLGIGGPGDVSVPIGSKGDCGGAEALPALQMLGELYARKKGIDTTAPRHLTKVVMLDKS